jgi:acetyl/propionyl-CoA carboxylase alpha subunit
MFQHLLIANRGEIALRIAQAAADMGLASTPVLAEEPAPFLDIAGLIAAARQAGCDAVHPGYGFLSERADFAQACAEAGLVFIGPTPDQLAQLGDKSRALALARDCGVPVLAGSAGPVDLAGAAAFMAGQGGAPVMLKAVGGGGGRGLRVVTEAAALPAAFERCRAEAARAFGTAEVYAERWLPQARHVEVQVLGDGHGVIVLGDRDCTLQRQHQKLVELAPAPLDDTLRQRLHAAALALARRIAYRSLGTFEFLLGDTAEGFAFIEANPRLQVEHTVTEAVTGLDLVQLQIQVARGASLAALGLQATPPARGCAVQWRLNAETLDAQGRALPATGVVTRWQAPGGAGVRVDSHARPGLAVGGAFDSLLAKLVVSTGAGGLPELMRRSRRALAETVLEGVEHNLPLLRALAAHPALERWALHTGFVQEHRAALQPVAAGEGGALELLSHMAGRLVAHEAAAGQAVPDGAPLALVEAMKMQHALDAPAPCRVQRWLVAPGAQLQPGQLLALLEPAEATAAPGAAEAAAPRADLARVQARWATTQDAARPVAVARRHALGLRMARENVAAT